MGGPGPQGRGRCAGIWLLSWEEETPPLPALHWLPPSLCPAAKPPQCLPVVTGSQGSQFELDFKPHPQVKICSQPASLLPYLCVPCPPMHPLSALAKWTQTPPPPLWALPQWKHSLPTLTSSPGHSPFPPGMHLLLPPSSASSLTVPLAR